MLTKEELLIKIKDMKDILVFLERNADKDSYNADCFEDVNQSLDLLKDSVNLREQDV